MARALQKAAVGSGSWTYPSGAILG